MEVTQNGSECRNCGSHNTLILNQGTIAPFFLKRVHNIRLMSLGKQINQELDRLPDTLIKKTLNSVFQVLSNATIGKQLNKFRSAAKTNISVCKDCGFVCPNYNYDDLVRVNYLGRSASIILAGEARELSPRRIQVRSATANGGLV